MRTRRLSDSECCAVCGWEANGCCIATRFLENSVMTRCRKRSQRTIEISQARIRNESKSRSGESGGSPFCGSQRFVGFSLLVLTQLMARYVCERAAKK